MGLLQAKEKVEKSFPPEVKTVPVVTKIEKIKNLRLERMFLEAQKELISPQEIQKWLFYGASTDQLHDIVQNGFKVPHQQVQPYSTPDHLPTIDSNFTEFSFKVTLAESSKSFSLNSFGAFSNRSIALMSIPQFLREQVTENFCFVKCSSGGPAGTLVLAHGQLNFLRCLSSS